MRKRALWLYRVRRELAVAYGRVEVLEPVFHDPLGVLHGHLEEDEHAVRYGRAAVALAPDFKTARHNLAVSRVASGEPEEAIEILEEILRQDLAAVEDYTSLVAAYADLGRWKSARDALVLAMASADLGNVDHLWRLTLASARAGKYERAVEMFGRYLAARAGHAQTEVVDAPLAYVLRALTEYGCQLLPRRLRRRTTRQARCWTPGHLPAVAPPGLDAGWRVGATLRTLVATASLPRRSRGR